MSNFPVSKFNDNKNQGLRSKIVSSFASSSFVSSGISKIADKLDIDACADIRILVLMHKMGATDQPATITKDEWMHGCSKLQLDSWEGFRKHLPALDTGFMCQSEFKDFYKFCFQFNREGTHKTLDKELAKIFPLIFQR